ncbi:MAG: TetR/AcrR family transcriptional regulator [Asticcacaulis sp.]
MPDTAAPGAKRSRRATPEVRQAAILDAALAEFARHGFADARVEDIARGASVSKGTVYLYYPTKQALFEALVRRDIGPKVEVISGFLKAYDGPLEPALSRIVAMLGGLIDAGQLPIYPRLLVAEAGRFPELIAFYRREVIGVTLGALSGLFGRAMDRGEIAREDPMTVAHLFIAPGLKAVLWSLVFAPVEDEPLPAGPYLATHVRLFLKGLQNA